jgi:PAS domain S-box-containing protein
MIENLEPEIIEAMLDSMPVEISFVDENDEVKYFNKNGNRIFPRPRSIVGRKVQQCHPAKSVHIVEKILQDFRNKTRKSAPFWIDLKGRKILIRYFPVWDKKGNYKGCLEVSEDITDMQKLTGEKRLLDEETNETSGKT